MVKILLLMVSLLPFTGCNDENLPQVQPVIEPSAVDNVTESLVTALKEARKIADPWSAFKKLDTLETAAFAKTNPCTDSTCSNVPLVKAVSDEMTRDLKAAVASGNTDALLFLHQNRDNRRFGDLTTVYIAELTRYLDHHIIPPEQAVLLVYAADLFSAGKEVVKNTQKAVTYYAMAWALGEKKAAFSAAKALYETSDYANAYLWALRCTRQCYSEELAFHPELELNALQERLSSETIHQVQKHASDDTILLLNGVRG